MSHVVMNNNYIYRISHSLLHLHMAVNCDTLLMVNNFIPHFQWGHLFHRTLTVCLWSIHQLRYMSSVYSWNNLLYRWKSFSILCNSIVEYIHSRIHGDIEMLVISLLHDLLFWVWPPPKVVDRVHTLYTQEKWHSCLFTGSIWFYTLEM